MRYSEIVKESNKLDQPTPTLHTLVRKHGVPLSALRAQLTKGISVEMEHTSDTDVAREIALDHLSELPDYYDKLEKVEQ